MLWGLALYLVRPLLPGRVAGLLAALLLIGAGVYLGWLEPSRSRSRVFARMRWLVGAALILVAAAAAWPRPQAGAALAWIPYSEGAFEQARREHRPMIIDLYADWCIPCVEMDHVTFRHPDVVQALSSVATLRLDVTSDVPPDGERLIDRHDVAGVPTVLLFDREGREHRDLRVEGPVGPKEFLRRLSKIE